MNKGLEIQVKRDQIDTVQVLETTLPEPGDGQVLVAIRHFALTANNVTYAVAGDMIGYWRFYPAAGEWGIVPVWGIAEVVASGHPGAAVGETLYGFFPMASHALLSLDQGRPELFIETSAHRRDLPLAYNSYRRTAADPPELRALEAERCIYFPLFMTAYLLYDFLVDNELFGAQQVIIGSASSKTAFGLASMLKSQIDQSPRVVGITSASNKTFVESLGFYDQVVAYGDETAINADTDSVYVDMSGDAGLAATVHGHLADRLNYSCAVGATHWESFGSPQELPGPQPEFFFAPAQIEKRDSDWGPGVLMSQAGEVIAGLIKTVAADVTIQRIEDGEAAASTWTDLVNNRVPPSRGLVVSLAV